MPNRDLVSQRYYGEIDSERSRESTQARIHWVVGHARGKKILDVGCSQGIVSILLGREGHTVTGIDIEEEAIVYARSELSKEPASVQSSVRFQVSDFMSVDYKKDTFDTIVFGEVIEHVSRPADFLEKAASLLSPGGIVVITVPFGLLDFHDHRRSYYVSSFFRDVRPFFIPSSFEVRHKNILFQGRVRAPDETEDQEASFARPYYEAALEAQEAAFLSIERELQDSLTRHKERLRRLEEGRDRGIQERNEARRLLAASEARAASCQERLSEMAASAKSSAAELAARSEEVSRLTERIAGLNQRIGEHDEADKIIRQHNERLMGEIVSIKTSMDDVVNSLRHDVTEKSKIIEGLSEELQAARAEVESLVRDHEVEKVVRQHNDLLLAEVTTVKMTLDEALDDLRREISSKEEEIKSILVELENSRSQGESLTKDNDAILEKLSAAEKELEDKEAELDRKDELLSSLETRMETRVTRLEAELSASQSALVKANVRLEGTSVQLSSQKIRTKELQDQLRESSNVIVGLTKFKEEHALLEAENARLRSEQENLMEHEESWARQLEEMRSRLARTYEVTQKLSQENKDISAQKKDLEKEVSNAHATCAANIRKALAEKNQIIDNLEESISRLEKQICTMNGRLAAIQRSRAFRVGQTIARTRQYLFIAKT